MSSSRFEAMLVAWGENAGRPVGEPVAEQRKGAEGRQMRRRAASALGEGKFGRAHPDTAPERGCVEDHPQRLPSAQTVSQGPTRWSRISLLRLVFDPAALRTGRARSQARDALQRCQTWVGCR